MLVDPRGLGEPGRPRPRRIVRGGWSTAAAQADKRNPWQASPSMNILFSPRQGRRRPDARHVFPDPAAQHGLLDKPSAAGMSASGFPPNRTATARERRKHDLIRAERRRFLDELWISAWRGSGGRGMLWANGVRILKPVIRGMGKEEER